MERGIRQDDLAELMGVMFGTVSKWERYPEARPSDAG